MGGQIGRKVFGQLNSGKSKPRARVKTKAVDAAQPADTEPEEPKLSDLQRRRIMSEAKQAALLAMATWALEHLPHESAPRNVQIVASWLMTVRGLRDFQQQVLKDGGPEHITGSVELHWGGKATRKSLEGGNLHHLFNASELAGSFEDAALVVARAFCGYTDSDEIHEIRGSNWMLLVTTVASGGVITPHKYVHKAERGSIGEQVGRELRSLGDNFARSDVERQRRRSQFREEMDGRLAIMVADALGHGKDLKGVYDTTYKEVLEEKEADALREQAEGTRRRWRR